MKKILLFLQLFFIGNLFAGGMYNLSTGNLKIMKNIHSIGAGINNGSCIAGPQNGWCSGNTATNTNAVNDGQYMSAQSSAYDPSTGMLYIVSTGKVSKINAATGAFVGAIGYNISRANLNSNCIYGSPQSGWCTGGTFAAITGEGSVVTAGGIAIDPSRDRMYIADTFKISAFVLSTGSFIGSIGNTSASTGTCAPTGAQSGWCTGGTFVTGAGDGMIRFNNSINGGGMAVNPSNGDILVMEMSNNRLSKFSSSGAFIGSIGNSTATGSCAAGRQSSWCTGGTFSASSVDGGFNTGGGVAIDSAGNVFYVKDNFRIQKFTLSTGAYVGSIGRTSGSSGTCVGGSVYQSAWCTGGTFVTGTTDGALTNTAGGLALDITNNHIYAIDPINQRLSKYSTSGAYIGSIGNSTAAGTCVAGKQNSFCTGGTFSVGTIDGSFNAPTSVSLDSTNGSLFVTARTEHKVQKFTTSGSFVGAIGFSVPTGTCNYGAQSTWCTGGNYALDLGDGLFYTSSIAIDKTNNYLYVGSYNYGKVSKFNLLTGAFIGSIGVTNGTTGTCGSSGAQSGWCTGGIFTGSTLDGGFTHSSTLALAIDVPGNVMIVSDSSSGKVSKFTLSSGVFVGAIGNVTSTTGTCVVAAKQSGWCTGGIFTTSPLEGSHNNSNSVAIDKTNNHLFVVSREFISKYNLTTGSFIGRIGNGTAGGSCINGKQNSWCAGGSMSAGTGDGMFTRASSIAIDSSGNYFLVTDIDTERVSKYTLSTGAFVGSIGRTSASSGTCVSSGTQSNWCTSGTFAEGATDGSFSAASSVAIGGNYFYVYDGINYRISKFSTSTGTFIGSIGYASGGGSCSVGRQRKWCTGGTFVNSQEGEGQANSSYIGSMYVDTDKNDLYFMSASKVNVLRNIGK